MTFPQTAGGGNATEDQQTAASKPSVAKHEEQDETSAKVAYDTVGAKDVVQEQHTAQYTAAAKPCCKQAARRMLYQQKDPCQQRSSLFKDSLLDASSDERRHSTYGRFYKHSRVGSNAQQRPAGVANNQTHIN